jgi:hypothetical protein
LDFERCLGWNRARGQLDVRHLWSACRRSVGRRCARTHWDTIHESNAPNEASKCRADEESKRQQQHRLPHERIHIQAFLRASAKARLRHGADAPLKRSKLLIIDPPAGYPADNKADHECAEHIRP